MAAKKKEVFPFNEIHPRFRKLSVVWCENYDQHGSIMPMIAQKQKLGSDIQHVMFETMNDFAKTQSKNDNDGWFPDSKSSHECAKIFIKLFKEYIKTSNDNGKKKSTRQSK